MAKSTGFLATAALAAFALAVPCLAQDTTTYTYDELGRVTTVTNPTGAKTGYNYDKADNRTQTQTALNGVINMNHAPTCASFTAIFNPPTTTPQQFSFSSATLLSACSDPDGDTLTITNPSPMPYTTTVSLGQKIPVSYTASDGKGGTASATATICRPGNGVSCP